MLIDAHGHLGTNELCCDGKPFQYDLSNLPDEYIRFMDTQGIGKAVILPIPGNNYPPQTSNDFLYEATLKYPQRFLPFCKLDSHLAVNLMCRGFYGAKYHIVYENYTQSQLTQFYKELEYYGFPLIIHAKFANKGEQIKEILAIAPKLKIILAHMGRGHIYTDEMVADLLQQFKDVPNLYFETSTVGRSRMIEVACETVGASRVMYGSDYPFGRAWFKDTFIYSDELSVVQEANITAEEKEIILHGTIEKIVSECDTRRQGFFVRPFRKEDKSEFESLLATLSENDRKMLAIDKKMSVIRQCIRDERHIYLAICGGKTVGFFRESGRTNHTFMLEEFAVFPQYRGQGYSRLMMEYYTAFFEKSFVKTLSSNDIMNQLLLKFSFTPAYGEKTVNWTHN